MAGCDAFLEATDDIEVKTTSKALNVRVVPWKFVRVKDEGTPLVIYQSYESCHIICFNLFI